MSVGIGRQRQFEIYVAGARGVHSRAGFDLTMGLAGVASVCDLGRENVTRV